MFDPSEFVINGVQLMALLFGLVEFIKSVVPIQGKVVQILSVVLGVGLFLLFRALPFMAEGAALWVGYVIEAVAFALATSGYYKFVKGAING